jgi:hypothetical protein
MGIFIFEIDSPQELQHTERPDKIVALLVIQQMITFFLRTHPRTLANDEANRDSVLLVVSDFILDRPKDVGRPR